MNSNQFTLGTDVLGSENRCFIIAEAGSNHNGDYEVAKSLISAAAEQKADAVKFQLFTGDRLSNDKETKDLLQRFEFRREWLEALKEYAESLNILFLATPFDEHAIKVLESINICAYKIASGDLTYLSFIQKIAEVGKPIILSVGTGNINEIDAAVETIFKAKNPNVMLMHCIAAYPTLPKDANLNRIKFLKERYKLPVGFSDHTTGIHISLAAIALGADSLEKHFTLNRNYEGPDHFFSIQPEELGDIVSYSKDIYDSAGNAEYENLEAEKTGMALGRRSLFATRKIDKGKVIVWEDIKIVRPNIGIQPSEINRAIGRTSNIDILENEPITWEKLN